MPLGNEEEEPKAEQTGRRRRAYAKGRRVQKLARAALEAQGAVVFEAPNAVAWIRRPGQGPRPITYRHDIFSAFDLLAAFRDGALRLYQVTTWGSASRTHRMNLRRLARDGFPGRPDTCAILAYHRAGRLRAFRLMPWPAFEWAEGGAVIPIPPGRRRVAAKIPLTNARP